MTEHPTNIPDEGVMDIVEAITKSIIFLTRAKSELFPDSIIQARGYMGGGGLVMQKRLLWLSSDTEEHDDEIAEGTQTTAAWLREVWALGPQSVDIHIAGDAEEVSGAIPNPDNPTNWVITLEFDEDGEVTANFFRVPPEVMRRMADARSS
jgi:hypothetical protein